MLGSGAVVFGYETCGFDQNPERALCVGSESWSRVSAGPCRSAAVEHDPEAGEWSVKGLCLYVLLQPV